MKTFKNWLESKKKKLRLALDTEGEPVKVAGKKKKKLHFDLNDGGETVAVEAKLEDKPNENRG